MYKHLLTEIQDHTLVITLNRPTVLNALNRELLMELGDVVEKLKLNDDLKGAIIIGSGDKAFAAGADISELTGQSAAEAEKGSLAVQAVYHAIERSPKPIIAAVNGFALGGGCELAMACHIRVASDNAKFGLPEVKLGLLPGYGGTQRLAQLIGRGRAIELMITGDMIDAQTALEFGLVNHLTTLAELADKCHGILQKAYKRSPKAISLALDAMNAGLPSMAGYAKEASNFGVAITSKDGKEGTSAFLEKRKPNFTGK
ncbi:MAG: enoyl-CoA hydratase/isomerase family protein [Bacteroidia bacterium]